MTAKNDEAGKSTVNARDAIRKRLESAVAARREAMSGSPPTTPEPTEDSDLLDELLLEATSDETFPEEDNGFDDLGDLDALIDDALMLPEDEEALEEDALEILLDEESVPAATHATNASPETVDEDTTRGRQDTPTLEVAALDPEAIAAFRARGGQDNKPAVVINEDADARVSLEDDEVDLSDEDVAALFDDEEPLLQTTPPPAPETQLQVTMEVAAVFPHNADHAALHEEPWEDEPSAASEDLVHEASRPPASETDAASDLDVVGDHESGAHQAAEASADDAAATSEDPEASVEHEDADRELHTPPKGEQGPPEALLADFDLDLEEDAHAAPAGTHDPDMSASPVSTTHRAEERTPIDTAAVGVWDGNATEEPEPSVASDDFEALEDQASRGAERADAAAISTPASTGSDRVLLAAMQPADASHAPASEESSLAALVIASGEGVSEASDDLSDDVALLESFEAHPPQEADAQSSEPGRVQLPMPAFDESALPELPTDLPSFREQAQHLARRGAWKLLAAWTTQTVNAAPWAVAATAVPLLQDLARLHRDRLRNPESAWEAWEAVLALDPAHDEALEQLCARWENEGQFARLYSALMAGVTAGWDPELRLRRTEEAARIALDRLQDPGLAAQAWEQLWQLGDAPEASARALANLYRRTEKWSQLAAFLQRHAQRDEGGAGLLAEREAASLLLHVLDDSASAVALLERRVQEGPFDGPAVWDLLDAWMRLGAHGKVAEFGLQNTLPGEEGQWRLERAFQLLWSAGRLERVGPLLDALRQAFPEREDLRTCAERLARSTEDSATLMAFLQERLRESDATDPARIPLLRELASLLTANQQTEEALNAWSALLTLAPQDLEALEQVEHLGTACGAWDRVLAAATLRSELLPDEDARLEAHATAARAAVAQADDPTTERERWWSLLQRLPLNSPLLPEVTTWWQAHGDLIRQRELCLLQARRSPERHARRHAAEQLLGLCEKAPENLPLKLQATWMLLDLAPDEEVHQERLVQALAQNGASVAAALLATNADLPARAQRWAELDEAEAAELLLEIDWRSDDVRRPSEAWAEAMARGGKADQVLAAFEASGAALEWVVEPDTLPAWWQALPEDLRDPWWQRWCTAAAVLRGDPRLASHGDATLANVLHLLTLEGTERRAAMAALADHGEELQALGFNPLAMALAAVFDQDALRESAGALHAKAAMAGSDLVHEAVLLACTEAASPEESKAAMVELARYLGEAPERAPAAALVWTAALRCTPEDDSLWQALDTLVAASPEIARLRQLALVLALQQLHGAPNAVAAAERLHPVLVPAPAVTAWLQEDCAGLLEVARQTEGVVTEVLLTEAIRRAPEDESVLASWKAHAASGEAAAANTLAVLRWHAARHARSDLYGEAQTLATSLSLDSTALDLRLASPPADETWEDLRTWLVAHQWHGEAQGVLDEVTAATEDPDLRLLAAAHALHSLQDASRALDHLEALPEDHPVDEVLLETLGDAASSENRLRWVRLMTRRVEPERAQALRVEEAMMLSESGDERGALARWETLLLDHHMPAHHLAEAGNALSNDAFAGLLLVLAERTTEEETLARLEDAAATLDRSDLSPASRARLRTFMLHRRATPDPLREVATLRRSDDENIRIAAETWTQDKTTCTPATAMLAAGHALAAAHDLAPQVLSWITEAAGQDRALHALELKLARQIGQPEAVLTATRRLVADLSDEQASWTLCALSEHLLTLPEHQHHAITLYREARTRQPANPCAREALRAWGRRQDALPSGAALLTGGEAPGSMDIETQLAWLDGKIETSSGLDHLQWCRRLAAIAPERPLAWATLALALRKNGALLEALRCDHIASVLRTAEQQAQHTSTADVLSHWLALGSRALELQEGTLARSCRDACLSLDPDAPPVVLLRAQVLEADGDLDGLRALLHQEGVPLLDENVAGHERTRAQLAWLCAEHGVGERVERLERALALDPRQARAAAALANEPTRADRPLPERITWVVRALSTEAHDLERGKLYAQLAEALEDQWAQVDEAAAACDLALAYGVEDRALLRRILRHCRQRGETQRGLELLDQLLPQASEPPELAALWLLKGQILLGDPGRELEATEAFDMALSYDTSLRDARWGLAEALERRGDWSALMDLLEGMVQEGEPHERAEAWLLLARVREQELGDAKAARDAAVEAWNLAPGPSSARLLLQLSEITREAPVPVASLHARLVEGGEHAWNALAAVGDAARNEQAIHAWCLLAPAMVIRGVDEDLRKWLKENRKTLERPALRWSPDWNATTLAQSPTLAAWCKVLAEEEAGFVAAMQDSLWRRSVSTLGEVSPHAPIGRAWNSLKAAAGLESILIHRTEDGPTTALAFDDNAWVIHIRQDVLPHLMRAELGYTLASIAFRAQPGVRLLSALSPLGRRELLEPLLDAARAGQPSPWAGVDLSDVSATVHAQTSAESLLTALDRELARSAAAAGLLAGPDLLQVLKLLPVLADAPERPAAFSSPEHFDAWVLADPALRMHASIAVDATFADALAAAEPLS